MQVFIVISMNPYYFLFPSDRIFIFCVCVLADDGYVLQWSGSVWSLVLF